MQVERVRIFSSDDKLFPFFWELYSASFPEEEIRPLDYQIETLEKDIYHLEIIEDNGEPIGFLAWWDLDDNIYIEHFATSPVVRGKGYGERVLRGFIEESSKTILLEVEHPDSDINIRRISFYMRIGLCLNELDYAHPSYHNPNDDYISLLIMSYPQLVDSSYLQYFKEKFFPIIHFWNF